MGADRACVRPSPYGKIVVEITMLNPRAEDGYEKLGELAAASTRRKVEVWSRTEADGSTSLELVECSWGSGVGWYVQKRVRLEASQVEALRSLLGTTTASPPRRGRLRPTVVREEGAIRLLFSA
jgi:hypothetical protein